MLPLSAFIHGVTGGTMIQRGKANVIIDGQFGSTGKGKLAGWLYESYPIQMAVCDYQPNAGHTLVCGNKRMVFRQLPVGAAFDAQCFIGPHAAIDVDLLMQEIDRTRDVWGHRPILMIHPLAAVVTREDKEHEAFALGHIASTAKGGRAATCRKTMLRGPLAKDDERLSEFIGDTQEFVASGLRRGRTALIETAQGFDLGLNQSRFYPYVTGRDCTVGRALDNAGVPVRDCGAIIGAIRTFPIRVGSTEDGSSGPFYTDQKELTWAEVSRFAGRPVEEMTTVTKRVRRVFSFSWDQIDRFLLHVRPTHMFLNFWNYLDQDPARDTFLSMLKYKCSHKDCAVVALGTGPEQHDIRTA